MRFRIAGLLALANVLTLAPGGALPDPIGGSGPRLELTLRTTPDPFTFDISAAARDPDGSISRIEICIDAGAEPACENITYPPPDLLQTVSRCVTGDTRTVDVTRSVPGYGIHAVRATAWASGCLRPEESVVALEEIILAPPPEPIPCAGSSGPATDEPGVTPTSVDLGMVVAISGPLGTMTGPALKGAVAAVNRINEAGGVCGRELILDYEDDGLDAGRGLEKIQQLIDEGKFALVSMPSPPGLEAAIDNGVIDAAGIPVIGTTGTAAAEFQSGWVWPVGAANETFGRSIVRQAHDAGARTFATVWLDVFGGEQIRDSVRDAIGQYPDSEYRAERRIGISEPSFESVINDLQRQCGGALCDAVILAIDLTNSVKFAQAAHRLGVSAPVVTATTALSFSGLLGRNAPYANGWLQWTSLHPPIPPAPPAAALYELELRSQYPNADPLNPYTELAYAGVRLAAFAMGRVGTNLTRAGLRAVLNTESFDLGLPAEPLDFSIRRNANRSARAYRIDTGAPRGYAPASGWYTDS